MKLDEFLTQGLIDSLNNGLIAPELITVYAGNYLAKSLITSDEMVQVQNAVTAYNTAKTSTTNSTSTSESASAATSKSASDTDSTSTSATTTSTAGTTTTMTDSGTATTTVASKTATN